MHDSACIFIVDDFSYEGEVSAIGSIGLLEVLPRSTKYLVTLSTLAFLQVLQPLIDSALLQQKELCHWSRQVVLSCR